MLRLDPVTHTYFWNGKKVPGVSQILQTVGLTKDWTGVDPFYKERGTLVHKCIELFLKGTLDEASVDPLLRPHFDGFRAYWSDFGTKPLSLEKMGYNEEGGYAGMIDLETEDAIIDWKCSKAHDRVAELQGEAYKAIFGKKNFRVVQFPGDGSYKIFEYGPEIRLWPHVLELYHWKVSKRGNLTHV